MKVKMATVCMNVALDKKKNLEKYLEYIDEASKNGADLIVFPEQSLQGYLTDLTAMNMSAGSENEFEYQYVNAELVPEGESVKAVIDSAKKNNIYVVFGMTEKDPDIDHKLYNTAVLVGPEGYVGSYRKVHQPDDELHSYYAGNEFPVFDTKIGKIGMLICYDKWFPESTRELTLGGAQLLIMPTATCFADASNPDYENDYGYYTFELMDRVRALENQTFFIASNQIGMSGRSNYFGNSKIVTPDGKVAVETGGEEKIVYYTSEDIAAEIYKAKHAFAGMSFLKDRHPGAYQRMAVSSPTSNYN